MFSSYYSQRVTLTCDVTCAIYCVCRITPARPTMRRSGGVVFIALAVAMTMKAAMMINVVTADKVCLLSKLVVCVVAGAHAFVPFIHSFQWLIIIASEWCSQRESKPGSWPVVRRSLNFNGTHWYVRRRTRTCL
jgi:hypothetical protein